MIATIKDLNDFNQGDAEAVCSSTIVNGGRLY